MVAVKSPHPSPPPIQRGSARVQGRQVSRTSKMANNLPSRPAAEAGGGPSELYANNLEGTDTAIEPEALRANRIESLTLDDFPSLALVNTVGIEFGKPKNVELEERAYVPTRPVHIQDFLAEPPQQPEPKEKTLKEKTVRKAHQAAALLKNPRADPRYPYLPDGLNLRIDSKREPLTAKFRKFYSGQVPKPSNAVVQRPPERVSAPELKPLTDIEPAEPRRIPKIKPSRNLISDENLDRFLNPLGGEFEVFHQTPQERAERIQLVNSENHWRNLSDQLLEQRGRLHIADWKIGRAPPLSRRVITESGVSLPKLRRIDTTAEIPGPHTTFKAHLSPTARRQSKQVLETELARRPKPGRRITFALPDLETPSETPFETGPSVVSVHAASPGRGHSTSHPHIHRQQPPHSEVGLGVYFEASKVSQDQFRPAETPKQLEYKGSGPEIGRDFQNLPPPDLVLPFCPNYLPLPLGNNVENHPLEASRLSFPTVPSSWEFSGHNPSAVVGEPVSSPKVFHPSSSPALDSPSLKKGILPRLTEIVEILSGTKNKDDNDKPAPPYRNRLRKPNPALEPFSTPQLGDLPRGKLAREDLTESRISQNFDKAKPSCELANRTPTVPTRTPPFASTETPPSPPIPNKSPERLGLIKKANIFQRNQILSNIGSVFNQSTEKYPSVLDDRAIPSPLASVNKREEQQRKRHSHRRNESVSLLSPPLLRTSFSGSPKSAAPLSYSPSYPNRKSGSIASGATLETLLTPVTLSPRGFELSTGGFRGSPQRPAMDNKLQVRTSEFGSVKTKALEDARSMWVSVLESCKKQSQAPPKYALVELIGKGSFGRVYKAKDMVTADVVAVKIIDIDESDHADPRNADTYTDFLKEISALKLLSANNAKNINNVVDAFPVGHAMWMVTQYCGGGSVATLMKPTAPAGLQEKWIIPILREVIEAITWVHEVGIIHRDIKCANVFITEEGGVQLGDFGVAGVVETKFDKRSTVVGTPHWMAPELFGAAPKYGKEVDIWALGSMVYEMATGLPPNAANGISVANLPSHLQNYIPRLVGDQYSSGLQDFVATCLEELPSARATIADCKSHPYTFNTSATHPTSSLLGLVRAFKLWEDHGGSRRSLFMLGGAQGPAKQADYTPYEDEWNFSTTDAFDQQVSRDSNPQDVYDAYGTGVVDFSDETSRPVPKQKPSRRRPPPEALAPLPVPLQKIFDSNTISNYNDNSRDLYGRNMQPPTSERPSRPISDLPLRDDTAHASIKDTMIDLGGHDIETGMSSFPEDTIKADRRAVRDEEEDLYGSLHDFSRPALSDPADMNPNRRTQDWKFPSMVPASADTEVFRFPPVSYESPRSTVTPVSSDRPTLGHHATDSVGGLNTLSTSDRMSLIDLDVATVPSHLAELPRPSTANSEIGSTASEYTTSGNPFELERHASMYQELREDIPSRSSSKMGFNESGQYLSDFSSDVDIGGRNGNEYNSDSDYVSMPPPRRPQAPTSVPANTASMYPSFPPPLQAPPSAAAMSGTALTGEMLDEFNRHFASMQGQLTGFREVYSNYPPTNPRGPGSSSRAPGEDAAQ